MNILIYSFNAEKAKLFMSEEADSANDKVVKTLDFGQMLPIYIS